MGNVVTCVSKLFDFFFPRFSRCGIKILPECVRYQMMYGHARVGKKELEVLLREGFINETIYLSAKALTQDVDAQRDLFETLMTIVCMQDARVIKDAQIARHLSALIHQLPDDAKIPAAKLVQISRQGFDLWDEMYGHVIDQCREEGTIPVFLSFATLIGFLQMLNALCDVVCFYLIVLDWDRNDRVPYYGYRFSIEHERPETRFLFKGEKLGGNVVLIDDTIHTGEHLQTARAFLGRQGNGGIPVKILCDARLA